MDWQRAAANWPAFVDAISARWPSADRAFFAIDGHRERLETYLSENTI
jgi:hypothetical protein